MRVFVRPTHTLSRESVVTRFSIRFPSVSCGECWTTSTTGSNCGRSRAYVGDGKCSGSCEASHSDAEEKPNKGESARMAGIVDSMLESESEWRCWERDNDGECSVTAKRHCSEIQLCIRWSRGTPSRMSSRVIMLLRSTLSGTFMTGRMSLQRVGEEVKAMEGLDVGYIQIISTAHWKHDQTNTCFSESPSFVPFPSCAYNPFDLSYFNAPFCIVALPKSQPLQCFSVGILVLSSAHPLKIPSTTLEKKSSQARLAAFRRRLSRTLTSAFWKQCPKLPICLALITSLPNQRNSARPFLGADVIAVQRYWILPHPEVTPRGKPSSTRPAVIIFRCHFKTTSPGRFSLCESPYFLLCQVSSKFTA